MNREKYYFYFKLNKYKLKPKNKSIFDKNYRVVSFTLKNEGKIHDFFCCIKWTRLEKCRSPPLINLILKILN